MGYAEAHAVTKTEEAVLKVCELLCCFGNGKKRTGFGGYHKFMRWVSSQSCSWDRAGTHPSCSVTQQKEKIVLRPQEENHKELWMVANRCGYMDWQVCWG